MSAAGAVFMVFVGCMSNVVFLELVVKEDTGAGHLITFCQFLCIALHGFIFTSKFGSVKPVINVKDYLTLVVFFALTNICNNYVFHFNVPVPLHIIFRSGSLITNMIMGVIFLKKSYTVLKYFSVILITFGIILSTLASADVKSTASNGSAPGAYEDFFWWSVGICLLTFALFLSSSTGIYQELLFKKYGKHPREVIYYIHLLPLPLFLFVSKNIYEHAFIAMKSELINVFEIIYLPKVVLYIIFNVLTQAVCISSVITLTSECSSLVVTLVLTLRKFASLLFSIVYFQNPFTLMHWIGTSFVFIGTILFTEMHQKIYDAFKTENPELKKD